VILIKSWNAPIYNGIMKYLSENPIPFHMPGHKLGRGFPEEFAKNLSMLDLTEIPGSDNLHCPSGIIREASELASKAFCADKTFFLVNGSTCGIHAIIMTICKPGGKLIVARDCHKSVINGMMLAGVNPVYIRNGFDSEFGIPAPIQPFQVERALKENPDAQGVLITRPSYYGTCSDIKEIAAIVHSYGKILAVDEAHGAHLVFNRSLPVCAMQGGADICVQSAHKTLPALTQGSYLHVKSSKVDMERLERFLRILQTSSPSYIIMASLDMARELMETRGEDMLDRLLDHIGWLENAIGETGGISMLSHKKYGNCTADRTRIVLNVAGMGITGFFADEYLRSAHHIQVEMSDMNNIVCIGTVSDSREYYEKLAAALSDIAGRFRCTIPRDNACFRQPELPIEEMELREVLQAAGMRIVLGRAKGMVSKDIITPYPPGIPVICPGEIISQDAIEYIYNIINSGGTVNGVGENFEVSVVA
jgi:arginine decarboxylase